MSVGGTERRICRFLGSSSTGAQIGDIYRSGNTLYMKISESQWVAWIVM